MRSIGSSFRRTTDGLFMVAGSTAKLHSVLLTSGSDAATAVLRDGGASGTIIATLAVPAASTSYEWKLGGMALPVKDLHVTFTGTTPSCTACVA